MIWLELIAISFGFFTFSELLSMEALFVNKKKDRQIILIFSRAAKTQKLPSLLSWYRGPMVPVKRFNWKLMLANQGEL